MICLVLYMDDNDILGMDYNSDAIINDKKMKGLDDIKGNMAAENKAMKQLAKTTKIDKIWQVYKKYIDNFVIGNEELKKIMFHMVIGAMLTKNGIGYIESGEKKSVRLHVFSIQDSGTGKSQTFKAIGKLLKHLDISCRITIKDNESAMTGSVYMNEKKGTVVTKKGLLETLNVWISDEGSVLLKKSPHNENMTDNLQHLMDEPGKVNKGMKLGTIEYLSNTTVVAGSYMFKEFQGALLYKGFLQRMFLVYKIHSDEEKRRIRVGKNLLKNIVITKRIIESMESMHTELLKAVKDAPENMRFNKVDTERFNAYLEKMHLNFVDMQYSGEKQRALETYFNRVNNLIDKLATHRAIVNGHKEVTYDDMMYGAELAKLHMESVGNMFDNIYVKESMSQDERKKILLLNLMKTAGGKVKETDLLTLIKTELHSKQRWDFNFKRTIMFLNKLVEEKTITKTQTENGENIYILM